jgi:Bacterial regulatory proteins, tetR family
MTWSCRGKPSRALAQPTVDASRYLVNPRRARYVMSEHARPSPRRRRPTRAQDAAPTSRSASRLDLERGCDAVSVQDVCAKPDVGRSTFYLQFADKEDLLLSGFDNLHASLARDVAGAGQPLPVCSVPLSARHRKPRPVSGGSGPPKWPANSVTLPRAGSRPRHWRSASRS